MLVVKKKKSCKESSQTGIFLGSHLKSSSHNPPTGLCILSLHLVQPPPFFLQRCAVGVRRATRAFSLLGGKGLSVPAAPQNELSRQRKQWSRRNPLPLLTLGSAFALGSAVPASTLSSHSHTPSLLDLHQKANARG